MGMRTGVSLWAEFWSSARNSYLVSKAFLSAGPRGYHHHLSLCLHLPFFLLPTLFLVSCPENAVSLSSMFQLALNSSACST